jgi:hypothetical protein
MASLDCTLQHTGLSRDTQGICDLGSVITNLGRVVVQIIISLEVVCGLCWSSLSWFWLTWLMLS